MHLIAQTAPEASNDASTLAIVAIAIAGLSAAFALWNALSTKKAADAATKSASAAEGSVHVAEKSADAAVRSAEASEKSYLLAVGSLELQKAEADKAEELRSQALRASLVPLFWEGRNGHEHRGLVIENVGQGLATKIRAVSNSGGPASARPWPALASGRTVDLLNPAEAPSAEETDGMIQASAGYVAARLFWTNADGSSGSTGWVQVVDNR